MLSIEGLSYEIEGNKILADVTFDVKEGAVVAMMGENGAGKTTLLRHISGLLKPQSGRISVFDHVSGNGKDTDPWVLAKDVGFVFQNPNHQIFGETIEKEIEFASVNFQMPTAEAKGATDRFASEEGVDKGTHPNCLSLGQKRRLNILSSSAHGPRLLLLDEPFIGQDRSNATRIANMIARLQAGGRTCIVVTHDVRFARSFCTDVILLNLGRVAAVGRPDDVLKGDRLNMLEGD